VVITDQGARINTFRAGEADIITGLSPEEIQPGPGVHPGHRRDPELATSNLAVDVNQTKVPMDDLDFRKAIFRLLWLDR
jgi:ABC-type transport system substrate-binding protein